MENSSIATPIWLQSHFERSSAFFRENIVNEISLHGFLNRSVDKMKKQYEVCENEYQVGCLILNSLKVQDSPFSLLPKEIALHILQFKHEITPLDIDGLFNYGAFIMQKRIETECIEFYNKFKPPFPVPAYDPAQIIQEEVD